MPRMLEYRSLEPAERKAALMRAAGASHSSIALELRTSPQTVKTILERGRVAEFLLRLECMAVDGIEDVVELLNKKIKTTAVRAFDIECENMEDLHVMGNEYEDPHARIRSKLGAVATAQDILDRAGNRAPTRTLNAHVVGQLPAEALDNLVNVLKESSPRDGVGGGEEDQDDSAIIELNKEEHVQVGDVDLSPSDECEGSDV